MRGTIACLALCLAWPRTSSAFHVPGALVLSRPGALSGGVAPLVVGGPLKALWPLGKAGHGPARVRAAPLRISADGRDDESQGWARRARLTLGRGSPVLILAALLLLLPLGAGVASFLGLDLSLGAGNGDLNRGAGTPLDIREVTPPEIPRRFP
ncbi:hypothetical protein T484DRAFT_1839479 [Baffinella frigidus]|nr:hypothetical protein T484DRAFT_1839479 [Cryptophyta sp. CCMP2293]